MDDFKGLFCNLGSYPIIEAVKEQFEHKITLIHEESEDKERFKLTTIKKLEQNKENYMQVNKVYNLTTIENNLIKFTLKTKIPKKLDKDITHVKFSNNHVKKFKAIREVKLIACLDVHKCSLNGSLIFNYNIILIRSFFIIYFYYLYLF